MGTLPRALTAMDAKRNRTAGFRPAANRNQLELGRPSPSMEHRASEMPLKGRPPHSRTGHSPHPKDGLAIISQKITSTPMKAGQPSQNHQRAAW